MNTKRKILIEFLDKQKIDIDLSYYLNDAETYDEFEKSLYDGAFDVEFIYYSDAMKYLMENDPSLQFATEAASDLGYETKDLNSCTLASVLAEENIREEYFKYYRTAIEDFFDDIDTIVRNRKIDEVLV